MLLCLFVTEIRCMWACEIIPWSTCWNVDWPGSFLVTTFLTHLHVWPVMNTVLLRLKIFTIDYMWYICEFTDKHVVTSSILWSLDDCWYAETFTGHEFFHKITTKLPYKYFFSLIGIFWSKVTEYNGSDHLSICYRQRHFLCSASELQTYSFS